MTAMGQTTIHQGAERDPHRDGMQRAAASDTALAQAFWKGLAGYYVDISEELDVRTRVTAEALLAAVDTPPHGRVLDGGCGHQRITRAMRRLRPNLQLVGADLTEQLLLAGRAQGARFPLTQADLAALPFGESTFDGVVAARVFQYIADPQAVLNELRRVVRPGGRVAIALPNRLNPLKRLRYKGRLSSPAEVYGWFEQAGFEQIQASSICFVPRPLGPRWSSQLRHVDRLASLPWVGLLGGNVIASGARGRHE
jgi:SAM-dependent methyltransferase